MMRTKCAKTDFKVLVGMIVVLSIPFALTLMTVKEQRPLVTHLNGNPTPHGYSWSLTLFIVPVLVLAVWQSLLKENRIQKKAFWITAALLAGCGVLLDVFFGLIFFNGFSGLPVEEPMLWMGVTWATVIVYETIYTLLYRNHLEAPTNIDQPT